MTLTELFTSIADKIREWNEWAPEKIKALNFPSEIENACAESHYSGYSVGVQEGKESMIDRSKIIEKTASGNPVVIADASELPHTVNIKVSNKNLFDKNNIDFYNAYINVNRQLWGHSIDSSSVRVKCDANTTYTVSLSEPVDIFRIASIESDSRPLVSGDGIPMANYVSLSNTQTTTTFTTSANAKYLVVQIPLETYERVINSLEIVTDKPVSGIKVTLLENGNSNTTDSNGECEFESLSPNMTFGCENVVDIEVNYWKSYGVQLEYDRFWDAVQNYGKETIYYQYRFFEFPEELFQPKYDFIFSAANSYSANATFRGIKAKDIQKNCDFTKMTAVGIYYTFYQSSALVNARTLKVNENVKYVNSFGGCTNLEEIRFEGSIGQNGLSFANSAKLSPDSLRSILTALSKNSTYASGKTITFNTASRSIIEADTECSTQLALAVSAGWTVAYNS